MKTKIRGAIKCHYKENGIDMICWNDNGPVTLVSNVHADLPLTVVKR